MPATTFDVRFAREQVAGRRHVVHGGVGAGAEQVLVARVLEDARRAAVEENGELLQLVGQRSDRETVAGGDVADHRIDVLPLDQVAVLGHLLGRAAGLVDDHDLDRRAVDALARVGRRQRAGVERLDGEFGRIPRRHAERPGRRSGQECDDAELHGARLLGFCRKNSKTGQRGGGHDTDPAINN